MVGSSGRQGRWGPPSYIRELPSVSLRVLRIGEGGAEEDGEAEGRRRNAPRLTLITTGILLIQDVAA